ncbi:MAG: hypothetical protein QOJ00_484 [Actinomycetota bacterium]|jgi:hypothetical protein
MVETAVNWALRRGLRKGLAGGSGAWLVIAAVAGAVKMARRPSKGADPVRLNLQPGERYSIVCAEEPKRGR